MRSVPVSLALVLSLSAATGARAQSEYAFVNVSVIPMDRDRVLSGQTVVVRGDKIVEIGPVSRVKVPAGATRIDGAGKYLIPSLAEMHAHINPDPKQAEQNQRILSLYALTGVSTIRGMLGAPHHLPLREQAARGEILSPIIYSSGPSLNGNSVPTADSAIRAVTQQKAAGYDFLKIHPGIKRDVFDSLAATAQRVGIRFAGHVPLDVGIERALEARYWSVDHLDGMVEGLVPHNGAFKPDEDGFFGIRLINRVEDARIPKLAAAVKAAGVWVVPTETLFEHVVGDYSTGQLAQRPEMRYWLQTGPGSIEGWVTATNQMRADTSITPAMKRRYLDVRQKLIRALRDAGVGFLLGSDSPQVWNVPGFSIRRELKLVVQAGLTPYQALESGTRNVAAFFGTLDRTGTVETGKRADLVLLDANPLSDIGNIERQAGVMLRGRWLPREEIQRRLDALATK